MSAQTIGQYRVGIHFNPSGADNVGMVKRMGADYIDAIIMLRDQRMKELDSQYEAAEGVVPAVLPDPALSEQICEVARLAEAAIDAVEDAAMWAVKALTKGKRGE